MFKDTKTSKSSGGDSFATNTIHNGTIIKGQINCEGNIRIDGVLEGTLSTKAKVVIGSTGVVRGNVLCRNANIEGKIDGEIEVQEILFLRKTAHINGDIITQKLVVEEGAVFNGGCSMGNKSNIFPAQKNGEEKKEVYAQEAV